MQSKRKAPVSPSETSEGIDRNYVCNIPKSSSNCNAKPLLSLSELYQFRTEIVLRIARLKRKGFWAKQYLSSLREEYEDNVLALSAVDQLISIAHANGEGVLS